MGSRLTELVYPVTGIIGRLDDGKICDQKTDGSATFVASTKMDVISLTAGIGLKGKNNGRSMYVVQV